MKKIAPRIYNFVFSELSFRSTLVLIVLLLINLIFFRVLQKSDAERTLSTIASILRNESVAANTYVLSKSFSDIESLGILRCTIIEDGRERRRIFYDTSSNPSCDLNSWSQFYQAASANITSINGVSFSIRIQPRLEPSRLVLEVLIYLIIVIVFLQTLNSLKSAKMTAEARIRAVELEKQMMWDHANQISHDVASPLSAINMIVELLPAMDSEVRSVLIRALTRTRELIGELSRSALVREPPVDSGKKNSVVSKLQQISVNENLNEIYEEKKALFLNKTKIIFDLDQSSRSVVIMGENGILKRVLSNLINNAAEALPNGLGKITIGSRVQNDIATIYVMDNGCGISEDLLKQLGTKGLTFGKEACTHSGAGLGLYHAKEVIDSWGGKMMIQSQVNSGTLVQLHLPLASETS